MNTINIDDEIVSVALKTSEASNVNKTIIQVLDENVKRPTVLAGNTYKIKSPLTEHAIYVTINNIILNDETEHATVQPFEIFINSRDMKNFQWITALTRMISAVFRKGGDITFIIEELEAIYDPNGGYVSRDGYVPSLVAEISKVIKNHFIQYGIIKVEVDKHVEKFIQEKKDKLGISGSDYPESATVCQKCGTKAVVKMDNCPTCLACGDSKCG